MTCSRSYRSKHIRTHQARSPRLKHRQIRLLCEDIIFALFVSLCQRSKARRNGHPPSTNPCSSSFSVCPSLPPSFLLFLSSRRGTGWDSSLNVYEGKPFDITAGPTRLSDSREMPHVLHIFDLYFQPARQCLFPHGASVHAAYLGMSLDLVMPGLLKFVGMLGMFSICEKTQ